MARYIKRLRLSYNENLDYVFHIAGPGFPSLQSSGWTKHLNHEGAIANILLVRPVVNRYKGKFGDRIVATVTYSVRD